MKKKREISSTLYCQTWLHTPQTEKREWGYLGTETPPQYLLWALNDNVFNSKQEAEQDLQKKVIEFI